MMLMTVLAIDDDPAQLARLRLLCEAMQYPQIEFLSAETVASGLAIIWDKVIDLVLTDLHLPDGSGLDVLTRTKALNPLIPIVIMTAYSDPKEAVNLLKEGADDYLVKPMDPEDVERLILRIHEKNVLIRESFLPPSREAVAAPAVAGIIYRGAAMAGVMSVAARCADSGATVLLSGESGTGKELVARFIHERGSRREKPFIAVNISALPESMAESELFGHRRGAFTGADSDRVGRFEEADGGTLFIDEIGDITATLQVKLLRAIQFGVIERVGENTPRKLNVRIIAATNRSLADLVDEGKFRKDLYYRINVIDIGLPSLRSRKEDIAPLIDHFIAHFNTRNARHVRGLTREAMDTLMKHSFPGNVRELENIIERAVVLCSGDLILERDLPSLNTDGEISMDYELTMKRFERKILDDALLVVGGNKSAAARNLGITERHLRSRLERLN
ncbi:MAG: sigma-54 dependent transcriptional regulator [Treponemataceae bacterium]